MTALPALQAGDRFPLRFVVAVGLMGSTALITQVVLMRELLAQFYGSELSIALVLAAWLTAVAAGSAVGSRLASRLKAAMRSFAWCQVFLAAAMPACLAVARLAHTGGVTRGQLLGPGAMLLTSGYVLAPVCAALGLQFVFAAQAGTALLGRGRWGRRESVSPVALVYALEAAGAVVGGAAFHYYLAEHVGPFRSLAGLGLLNVLSGCWLLRPKLSGWAAAAALLLVLPGTMSVALIARSERMEIATLRASHHWSGVNPVAFVPSKHGALVVGEQAGQVSVFQSGVLLFTSQDEYWNEAVAHLPLLEHENPRRVLLIGGAVAGLAGEALKHPVTEVECVELDPRVLELAERWLPAELLSPLSDERARVELADGRLLVKRARARYDVIIVNLPDPTTAALNRFYTEEFLREARDALAPGGLVAFTLSGSPHHLSGSVRAAAATTLQTVRAVFAERLVVPGEQMIFLAARDPGTLSADWEALAVRLRQRKLETAFVNEVWLQDALRPFRRELILESIREAEDQRPNTDLNPISYHHQTLIWLDQVSPRLAGPIRGVSRVALWWAAVPIALAALGVGLCRRRRGSLRVAAALVATAGIGGFGLLVEVLALLAFQSARGYLYHALGALTAAFMAGLAIGSAAVSTREISRRAAARIMAAGLGGAAIASALMPRVLAAVLAAPAAAGVGLGLLLGLVGFLVGALFPVATALYRREQPVAAAGGAVYAADLLGSAGAAVAAGAIAVPLLGAAGTCYAGALLLTAALVLVLPFVTGD